MTKKKIVIWFVALCALGLGIGTFVSAGFYPIATANGALLSNREFRNRFRAVSLSYKNYLETYREILLKNAAEAPEDELESLVLDEMIEDALIREALAEELGEHLSPMLQAKLENVRRDPALARAAQSLYGLRFEEFEKEILLPLARREVLEGRLYLKEKTLGEWLGERKKTSRVRILSGSLYWDGEHVRRKK